MTTPPGLYAVPFRFSPLDGPGGLANGVGERLEVVVRRLRRLRVGSEPEHLPAPRGRESFGVEAAQVVAVRLGVDRERAENGRPVRVDVRQGGDGLSRAGST